MYYGAYGQFLAADELVPEWALALEMPLYYNYNFHIITFTLIMTLFYHSIEAVIFCSVFYMPLLLHMFDLLNHVFKTFSYCLL